MCLCYRNTHSSIYSFLSVNVPSGLHKFSLANISFAYFRCVTFAKHLPRLCVCMCKCGYVGKVEIFQDVKERKQIEFSYASISICLKCFYLICGVLCRGLAKGLDRCMPQAVKWICDTFIDCQLYLHKWNHVVSAFSFIPNCRNCTWLVLIQ